MKFPNKPTVTFNLGDVLGRRVICEVKEAVQRRERMKGYRGSSKRKGKDATK